MECFDLSLFVGLVEVGEVDLEISGAWMEISWCGWKLVGVTGNYKCFDLCLGNALTCAWLWDAKAPPAGWNCGGALLV